MTELICWNCSSRTPTGICTNCGVEVRSAQEVLEAKEQEEKKRVIEVKRKGKKVSYLDLNELTDVVNNNFKVIRSLLIEAPKFLVELIPNANLDDNFNQLIIESNQLMGGLTPKLQRVSKSGDQLLIQYAYVEPFNKITYSRSMKLLVLTFISMLLAGMYNYTLREEALGRQNSDFNFYNITFSLNSLLSAFYFSITLIGILLIKDVTQVIIARRYYNMQLATYFIPAPPMFEIGTLGSFLGHKSLHKNRSSMFYTALIGPLLSWTVSIIIVVLTLGFASQNVVSIEAYSDNSILQNGKFEPIILKYLAMLSEKLGFWNGDPDQVITRLNLLHPITLAGLAGIYLSGLNLLPASYLNGGHLARAKLGKISHLFLTYLIITSLIFVNFFFSLLLLLVHQRLGTPDLLNEESKIHWISNVFFGLALLIALLSFPLSINLIY